MKVKSSMIDEIFEWKEVDGQGQFDVKFPNGKVFRYYNVPKGIYEKLISASSIGSFFDFYIKKAGYRFNEVVGGGAAPNRLEDVVKTAREKFNLMMSFSDKKERSIMLDSCIGDIILALEEVAKSK